MWSAPLRNKPLWMRVFVTFLIGVVLTAISMAIAGSASAAPSSAFAGKKATATIDQPWGKTCWGSQFPDVCRGFMNGITSPDARQAAGNAGASCIVGAIVAGGPGGCLGAAAGSLVTSVPFDGTWD